MKMRLEPTPETAFISNIPQPMDNVQYNESTTVTNL
jgi:hypothetical protein